MAGAENSWAMGLSVQCFTCTATGAAEDSQPAAIANTADRCEAHGIPGSRQLPTDSAAARAAAEDQTPLQRVQVTTESQGVALRQSLK